MGDETLFRVLTPLGFHVYTTASRWELIVNVKHPVMRQHGKDVLEVLQYPDEIRQSRTDPNVYLFYRKEHPSRWVCAVIKLPDGEGFLITAYPTDAIKEGEKIWSK